MLETKSTPNTYNDQGGLDNYIPDHSHVISNIGEDHLYKLACLCGKINRLSMVHALERHPENRVANVEELFSLLEEAAQQPDPETELHCLNIELLFNVFLAELKKEDDDSIHWEITKLIENLIPDEEHYEKMKITAINLRHQRLGSSILKTAAAIVNDSEIALHYSGTQVRFRRDTTDESTLKLDTDEIRILKEVQASVS